MKKFAAWIVMCSFLLMTFTGCAYNESYGRYAEAQSNMATAAGPIVSFHENGALASVGNPMVAMAMMNMKPPRDGWESFFDFLKFATPFAAMYGLAGALSTNLGAGGSTTNITGNSNLTGNTAGAAGAASSWASPVTTTTTTNTATTTNPAK